MQLYDLKGSKLGRLTAKREKTDSRIVLKDIDVLSEQTKFRIGKRRVRDLDGQVEVHMHVYFGFCMCGAGVWI